MSRTIQQVSLRPLVIAVHIALLGLASAAAAAENTVEDLTKPVSTVEIGAVGVSGSSAKFGEYNGLDKSGALPLAGFDIRGGGAYDSDSVLRFRLTGKDLGLDTRSLGGEVGEQGRFRLSFGYDSLVKNRSDSYQTFYQGAGSNALALPSNWATNQNNCVVSATSTGPVAVAGGTAGCGNYYITQATNNATTATPVGNALALTAAELSDFYTYKLATKREKYDVGATYVMDSKWSLSASTRHELKNGAQAIGLPFVTTNAQVTIANPISYVTDQANLAISFKDGKAYGELAYYLSNFHDNISSVLVDNPYFSNSTPSVAATTGIVTFPFPADARISTMPDNKFQQYTLNGGYNFSPAVKFSGNLSSGRGTQNQSYMPPGTGAWETAPAGALPQNSLNGLVKYSSALFKLTLKPMRDLQVVAAYKFDERDNQTASNLYNFRDTDQQTTTVTGAANGSVVLPNGLVGPTVLGGLTTNSSLWNLPYSKKVSQGNLDLDYRLARGQAVKLALESQKLSRWCNTPNAPATSVNFCINSLGSSEKTARLDYRNNMLETLSGRISVAHSSRTAESYRTDVAEYAQDILTRFNMTDRTRNRVRASLNWAPTDALDFGLNVGVTKDDYVLGRNPLDTAPATLPAGSSGLTQLLGVQSSKTQSVSLDAGYRASDTLNFNAYFTKEDINQLLKANGGTSYAAASSTVTPPDWAADMVDQVRTFGFGVKATELHGGKVELIGDFVRVRSSNPYGMSASTQYAFSTSATAPTATMTAAAYAAGISMPPTYADSDTLKFGLKYELNKTSAIRLSYVYQKLASADPILYNGLQAGAANAMVSGSATAKVNGTAVTINNVYAISALMPTNEQAPNYSITAIGIAYIYSFR